MLRTSFSQEKPVLVEKRRVGKNHLTVAIEYTTAVMNLFVESRSLGDY